MHGSTRPLARPLLGAQGRGVAGQRASVPCRPSCGLSRRLSRERGGGKRLPLDGRVRERAGLPRRGRRQEGRRRVPCPRRSWRPLRSRRSRPWPGCLQLPANRERVRGWTPVRSWSGYVQRILRGGHHTDRRGMRLRWIVCRRDDLHRGHLPCAEVQGDGGRVRWRPPVRKRPVLPAAGDRSFEPSSHVSIARRCRFSVLERR